MDIKQLRYFLALSQHGNMTRAAQELYITQQALSKVIRNFEQELETSLFERTARGLLLTESRKCLLPYAKKAIRSVDAASDALAELRRAKQTTVKMGYVIGSLNAQSALPPSLIARWEQSHPDTSVFIEEYNPVELIQMVLDEELDFAYTVYREDFQMDGVAFHILARERMYVLIPQSHPAAHKPDIGFDDLRALPVLAGKVGQFPRESLASSYRNAGYEPELRLFNGSFSQCVERVRMGDGIMVAGKAYCMTVHPQGLAARPFPDASQGITHALVYKAGRALPAYVRGLLTYVKRNCRDLS